MPENVDLTTCDREPIHIPGSIQTHGCLLVCDENGDTILRSSLNIVEMLKLGGDPAGKSLSELFSGPVVHSLLNAIAKSKEPRRPGLAHRLDLQDAGFFDVSCHTCDGVTLLEFEPAASENGDGPLDIARSLIARTQSLMDREALFEKLPRFLQAVLGYDRVMIYEFSDDGSGKVAGEAKRHHLESFLGQHFPASDIPSQARALYLQNTIRVISDAKGESSPIIPEYDASGTPLDLSFAHLRSVSPIHLEYLRNMGVAASMSVSIIVDGKLFGLVACHHYAPKALGMSRRIAMELFGDFLSLHLTSIQQNVRADATRRARHTLDEILASTGFNEPTEEFLRQSLPKLNSVLDSDGVGLWMNGTWSAHGSTPPSSVVPMMASLIREVGRDEVWATNALQAHLPSAAEFADAAAGVLAIPLSLTQPDFLFFFRKEKLQTLNWAGDPNKTYTTGPHGDRLTPRKSFAVWKQIVAGQSESWSVDERTSAQAVLLGLREVMMRQSEILAKERNRADARMRLLNDELNHRVKNILALIKSLVNQPTGDSESIEAFVSGLKGRILALSHAHDQVVRSDGGGSLRQLLGAELSPYPMERMELIGDDIGLDQRAYSVMALVVHELATNAAKYGSLSNQTGQLAVNWSLNEENLEIVWREEGGPPVFEPKRKGFGSIVLHRSIPHDLQGGSEIAFLPGGLAAKIAIPVRFTSRLHKPVPAPPQKTVRTAKDAKTIAGRSILLVEDQLLIALEAEDMLRSLGAGDLVAVGSASDALRAIGNAPPDLAVLDVNLGSSNSLAVADELRQRKVPFVFATGYGDMVMIPEHLRSVPVVRKPYTEETLLSGLLQASSS
ncbi:MAG: HWE histidine kinase domain-containing protein [Hyphomicrobiaceae bacterium]